MATICVTITIAWFATYDWGNRGVGMSGRVSILAVGKGDEYHSIEDGVESTNLVVNLSDDYQVFIPGIEVDAQANVKVFQSTTSPLLRAKFSVLLFDKNNNQVPDYLDEINLKGVLEFELQEIIGAINDWYRYSDGFYYYIGNNTISSGDTLLQEINVTDGDVIVPFINKSFKFPTSVESTYSGYGVKFKIEFQAIQNYIPDENGIKIANTITNSYKIFANLEDSKFTPTDYEYFDIKVVNGVNTISVKAGVELPEDVVLPSYDADGKPITHISGSMKDIKNLVVPSTYTSMDASVFSGAKLQSVDMSRSNITVIPEKAFYNCTQLSTVLLPSNLEELAQYAFANTGVTSLILPDSLTTIKGMSLYLHKLTYLYIPKNVTYISVNSPLISTSGILQKIEVDEENPAYKDDQGIALLSKDGKTLYYMVQGGDVTEYHIPDGVETIRSIYQTPNNFSLYIPASVKTIMAFDSQYRLKNIYVDEDSKYFKSVEDNTFLITYDGKRGIVYANKNTRRRLTIPDTVETLDYYSIHMNQNLKEFVIGANVSLDKDTQKALRLLSCYNVEKIEVSASNKNYYCENGLLLARTSSGLALASISKEATANIVIPDGVQIIESNILKALTFSIQMTVTFPASITKLGPNNTMGGNAVKYYEFKGSTPPTIDSSFNSTSQTFKVYVPDSAVSAYKAISALSRLNILPVSQKS